MNPRLTETEIRERARRTARMVQRIALTNPAALPELVLISLSLFADAARRNSDPGKVDEAFRRAMLATVELWALVNGTDPASTGIAAAVQRAVDANASAKGAATP